ncbi:hypothetical protein [Mucilaginibacter kameinonensis]|uniref:hypothetical protein n=1 Tax=Mucilaginibacter kameinonensis TaxID=452286 RepID=UPI000EF850CA|nr:hypothetical protein [Mucilaginibacter kameinonensis]
MERSNEPSISWQELAPRGSAYPRETFDSYLIRIRLNETYDHIPDEVFEQWIYPLHQDEQTLRNYAWLDVSVLRFDRVFWSFEQLQGIHLIDLFEPMRRGYDNEFARLPKSEAPYWETHCTWRVPPIIADIDSLPKPFPNKAELRRPYQLVEGHSRFHNLLISQHQQLHLAALHPVYLMRGPGPQKST